MQGLLTQLLRSIVEMPFRFVDIAFSDPLSAVLILFGTLFVGVASAIFGYLSLGAALSLFTRPGSGGRSPPHREAR